MWGSTACAQSPIRTMPGPGCRLVTWPDAPCSVRGELCMHARTEPSVKVSLLLTACLGLCKLLQGCRPLTCRNNPCSGHSELCLQGQYECVDPFQGSGSTSNMTCCIRSQRCDAGHT